MLRNRVIPVLLLEGRRLVKGRKFKNHQYVGDPINTVKIFNDKEVDELLIYDISASRPNFSYIEDLAEECFIPLTYGGGISNIGEVETLFKLGIEKVSLQSALFKSPEIICEIADRYGSQSVSITLDVKKNIFGKYVLYDYRAKRNRKVELDCVLNQLHGTDFAELILNTVHRDGTRQGIDLELVNLIRQKVKAPLVISGGVGCLLHIKDGISAGADAVGAGNFFVYHPRHDAVLISYPKYNDLISLLNQNK